MHFINNAFNRVLQIFLPSDRLAIEDARQEEQMSAIGRIPEVIWRQIFEYLTLKELGGAYRVSKEWHRLTSEDVLWQKFSLEKVYQWSKVINKDVWQGYGVEVTGGEDKPLGKDRAGIKRLVEKLDNLAEQVDGDAGLTLLTMPGGITLNGLLAMAGAHGVPRGRVWNRIVEEIGADPVAKTYTIVITNSVLKTGRNETFAQQQKTVSDLGYAMPKVLEAAALNLVTYMESPPENRVRLYGDNPLTYTRCSEDAIGNWRLVVGGFTPSGLPVLNFYSFGHEDIGVSACGSSEVLET